MTPFRSFSFRIFYTPLTVSLYVLLLSACQPLQTKHPYTAPSSVHTLEGLAAYQQIEISHNGNYQRFDAALEITKNGTITLRLISEIGQPLATVAITEKGAQLNRANRYVNVPSLSKILQSLDAIFLSPPPIDTREKSTSNAHHKTVERRALFQDGALARVIEYDKRCAWNGGAIYNDILNRYQVTVTSVLLNPTKTNTYHEFRCP